MNMPAQVRHLTAKDIREARWMLAVYVAVVGAATAQSVRWDPSDGPFAFLEVFVVITGMVLVASLVQADSPARADAFWATRPIDPTAVVVAKLVIAAAIVTGIALVGQLIAIESFDVQARELPVLLGQSAAAYAVWLLVAMVTAALTRDLKSAFVALAVALLVGFVGVAVLPAHHSTTPGGGVTSGPMLTLLATLPLLAAVVLLAVLYRVRDPRPTLRIGGVVIVAAIWYAVPSSVPNLAHVPDAPAAGRPALNLTVHDYDKIAERRQIWLTIEAPTAPDSVRVSLVDPVVVLRLTNGDTIRLPLAGQTAVARASMPRVGGGVQWLNGRNVPPERMPLTVTLDAALRDSVAAGIVSVTLEGQAVILLSRTVADLPLTQAASTTRNGGRIRIDTLTHGHGDVSLTVHALTIGENSYAGVTSARFPSNGAMEGVLVGNSGKEAALLNQPGNGSGNTALVLPGVPTSDRTMKYEWDSNSGQGQRAIDDAWLRGARLILLGWIPIESYPVRLTFAVP